MERESLYGAQAIRMIQLRVLPDPLVSDIVQRETEIRGRLSTAVLLLASLTCIYSMVDGLDAGPLGQRRSADTQATDCGS